MSPAKPHAPRNQPAPRRSASAAPPETIDPVWLLKAITLTLLAALICAWLTACLLVYQGAWQLILHPSRGISKTPTSLGLAYNDVHFDASETGQPRLTAWWIPAQSSSESGSEFQPRYTDYTILFLHDGGGSLSETLPTLARLHQAGLKVFAIDYRGYGASTASGHPSDASMAEDANAALEYLTATRHISAHNIIPYGEGLAAALAANLARDHPDLPAVILENPNPDPAAAAVAAHPSRILPIRLLFGHAFDIATPIANLATPKLLIAGPSTDLDTSLGPTNYAEVQALFRRAASPSFAVTLPYRNYNDSYQTALRRFLDQYLQNGSQPADSSSPAAH